MVQMNLFSGQGYPENDDIENGHVDTVGEGEGGINWESRINT